MLSQEVCSWEYVDHICILSFSAFIVKDTSGDDRDRDRPRSKGFGFVTFVDMVAADECVLALHGTVSI